MAIIESNNLPVHAECMISYPYGVLDSGYSCGWHTGVDFVPHGSTENNPYVYPVTAGEVVQVHLDPNNALGIYILLYDGVHYWRYCHLMTGTVNVAVGQQVTKSTPLARMDSTGNVTGRHLHLECSTTQAWQCDTFVNPCTIMGIPNEDDQVFDWIPEPEPPPPPSSIKKNKFKWVLYARRLREKR